MEALVGTTECVNHTNHSNMNRKQDCCLSLLHILIEGSFDTVVVLPLGLCSSISIEVERPPSLL